MHCGIEVSGPLIPWINRKAAATGTWAVTGLNPFRGLSFAFESNPSIRFNPDWTVSVEAQSMVHVAGLNHSLPSPGFEFLLNPDNPLAGALPERSTTFLIPRGGQFWNIDLARESDSGWSFEHSTADPLFNQLQVESACLEGRVERSALLLAGEA